MPFAVAATLVVGALVLSGCSSDSASITDPGTPQGPSVPERAGDGPFFGTCGGVTTEEVISITGFRRLGNTVNNPASCVWGTGELSVGAVASFNWYRGSPIGRERATVQLTKDTVTDVEVNGHHGFIASSPTICEVGIGFGADFFEWSVRSAYSATGEGPTIEQICDATRHLSRLSIERAS